MKRNVDNLLALADLLDDLPPSCTYTQNAYGMTTECGTYACVAGLEMIRLYGAETFVNQSVAAVGYRPEGGVIPVGADWDLLGETVDEHAARSLGLTNSEAGVLFDTAWTPAPDPTSNRSPYNDPHLAAEALRRLARGESVVDVTDPDRLSRFFGGDVRAIEPSEV